MKEETNKEIKEGTFGKSSIKTDKLLENVKVTKVVRFKSCIRYYLERIGKVGNITIRIPDYLDLKLKKGDIVNLDDIYERIK